MLNDASFKWGSWGVLELPLQREYTRVGPVMVLLMDCRTALDNQEKTLESLRVGSLPAVG